MLMSCVLFVNVVMVGDNNVILKIHPCRVFCTLNALVKKFFLSLAPWSAYSRRSQLQKETKKRTVNAPHLLASSAAHGLA